MHADWASENIILGLLCEKPMHGYELSRVVQEDEALHAIWRIERSEIYFLMGKLKQRAFIVELAEERSSGPARTIYAPTEAGRAAYEQWLQTPELRPRHLRTALLARIWMALRYDSCVAVRLIDAQKQVLEEWLGQAAEQKFDNEVVGLVHRLRAAQAEAVLETLDELRRIATARIAASGREDPGETNQSA
jgi:DNA-binding PadR family transcriptional regulator